MAGRCCGPPPRPSSPIHPVRRYTSMIPNVRKFWSALLLIRLLLVGCWPCISFGSAGEPKPTISESFQSRFRVASESFHGLRCTFKTSIGL